jgi:beta-N-acetylhexosaminidase
MRCFRHPASGHSTRGRFSLISVAIILSTQVSMMLFAQTDPLDPEAEQWVQTTLEAMSLEQRVGQLLKPAIPREVADSPEIAEECVQQVEDLGIGCFTLRVTSAQVALPLVERLQAASEIPLLISVNFERGAGHFWSDATLFPRPMALAATGDPETARTVGAITAHEALACGVHWTLVPICDVNINPANPIINIRSYGEDVDTVSRFSAAFVEGCQGAGLLACAKHFPGHGDTATDSHLGLAVVDVDRARLDAVELPPFRAAIEAGVGSVMTSHIWFPALMGDEGQIPATISPHVLTGLLREEMGFEGLIITDSMAMHGITERLSPGEAAIVAVAAGADVLLDSPDVREAHAALVAAVRDGILDESRIDESAERILRAKARLGLHCGVEVDAEAALRVLRHVHSVGEANSMAQRAITVVRDDQGILPLAASEESSLLHIALYDDWPRWDFDDVNSLRTGLRTRFGHVSTEIAFQNPEVSVIERFEGPRASRMEEGLEDLFGLPPARRAALLEQARDMDITLVTAFVRTASYRGSVGLGEDQLALVHSLADSGRPMILVVLGSPYVLTALPEVPCQILTYDSSALFTSVLPGALVGESPITGRLPVTLPGIAERGHGLQIPARGSH